MTSNVHVSWDRLISIVLTPGGNHHMMNKHIRKMTIVHPRAHATTNMTNVKGGRGKEIILKIHFKQLITCPFHTVPR